MNWTYRCVWKLVCQVQVPEVTFFLCVDDWWKSGHAVSCRHWHIRHANWRLTCHPKRRRPPLPADRPPCRLLLLPLQQPMGAVRSYEGCLLLKITKIFIASLLYIAYMTQEQRLNVYTQWHTHVVPLGARLTVRIIVVVGDKFETHLWISLCIGQFHVHLWLNSVKDKTKQKWVKIQKKGSKGFR